MEDEDKINAFRTGVIGEKDPYFEIKLNYTISEYDKRSLCPHVVDGKLPALIHISCEDGYNWVSVCYHCIAEAVKSLEI